MSAVKHCVQGLLLTGRSVDDYAFLEQTSDISFADLDRALSMLHSEIQEQVNRTVSAEYDNIVGLFGQLMDVGVDEFDAFQEHLCLIKRHLDVPFCACMIF